MKEADPTLIDLRSHYKKMSRGFGSSTPTRREIDRKLLLQEKENPLPTRDEYGFPLKPGRRRGW